MVSTGREKHGVGQCKVDPRGEIVLCLSRRRSHEFWSHRNFIGHNYIVGELSLFYQGD